MATSLFKRNRRRFEEETAEAPAAEAAETTESDTNSDNQFITILTDMGLSAEQAQAVYQMAQDLAKEGSGEKVEASRMRRARMSAMRRRMAGRGTRERFSSEGREARAERFERRQRPARSRFARSERMARPERFGRTERSARPERNNFSSEIISRQRATIAELRAQLKEFGAQPAAQRMSSQRQAPQAPVIPAAGSIQERVFEAMKNFGK
jgi:hypothetical protein